MWRKFKVIFTILFLFPLAMAILVICWSGVFSAVMKLLEKIIQ